MFTFWIYRKYNSVYDLLRKYVVKTIELVLTDPKMTFFELTQFWSSQAPPLMFAYLLGNLGALHLEIIAPQRPQCLIVPLT